MFQRLFHSSLYSLQRAYIRPEAMTNSASLSFLTTIVVQVPALPPNDQVPSSKAFITEVVDGLIPHALCSASI